MPGTLDVVVGMSGGVDSSVAAALLVKSGYRVAGVTMKLWDGPVASSQGRHGCYGPGEEQDIDDARQVAGLLGIPFRVIDVAAEYRSGVLDYFRSEYRLGRTPNPCSRCNPTIKFGALVSKVRDSGVRLDYFATGHYVNVERRLTDNRMLLTKATDRTKDQSYFLALLSREQVERSLFPLGGYSKDDVRRLAAEWGLPVAAKPDSQDFVDREYRGLQEPSNPGPILDGQGNELGKHDGIGRHTIGQRRGLGVAGGKPLYVTALDPARNAVIVGERSEISAGGLVASNLNWLAIDRLNGSIEVSARIRYRHEEAKATVGPLDGNRAWVEFETPQMAITPGQTVVFYDGDIVVGGGIIDSTKE
jgi:tRNA-specific 2-thiouridylase